MASLCIRTVAGRATAPLSERSLAAARWPLLTTAHLPRQSAPTARPRHLFLAWQLQAREASVVAPLPTATWQLRQAGVRDSCGCFWFSTAASSIDRTLSSSAITDKAVTDGESLGKPFTRIRVSIFLHELN